jgi:hypothetical protein
MIENEPANRLRCGIFDHTGCESSPEMERFLPIFFDPTRLTTLKILTI